MRAFWLPSKTPEAKALLGRPDMDTFCPASGKKLRLKDLIPVRLTRVPEGQTGFAMDPITKDTFTNASRLVLLKPTGAALPSLRHPLGSWRNCIPRSARLDSVALEGRYCRTPLPTQTCHEMSLAGSGLLCGPRQ